MYSSLFEKEWLKKNPGIRCFEMDLLRTNVIITLLFIIDISVINVVVFLLLLLVFVLVLGLVLVLPLP